MPGRIIIYSLFIIVALQLMLSKNAHAYLDPGVGSFIFQVLIATFIGGLYAMKRYWQIIKDFFIKRFSRKEGK